MELTKIISGEMYYYFNAAYQGIDYEFTLDEEISEEVLRQALTKTAEVHPYITWTAAEKDGDFYYQETGRAAVLLHAKEPPVVGTTEFNGQLMAFYYYGNKISTVFYHGLMDGVAARRVMETLLYHYFSIKDGVAYPATNIVLDSADAHPSRFAEPYEKELTGEISEKKAAVDWDNVFRFLEHEPETDKNFVQYAKIKSDIFMDFVRANHTSPAAAFGVLISHAIQKMVPDNRKLIRIIIPVDLRTTLGVPETFRNTTGDVAIFFDPNEAKTLSIEEQCHDLRTKLKEEMRPENLKAIAKGQLELLHITSQYRDFAAKADFYAKLSAPPSDSFFISYMGKVNADTYGEHITDVSFATMVRTGIVFNIFDAGGYFQLTMIKRGSLEPFTRAFHDAAEDFGLKVLSSPEKELTKAYVGLREYLGLKK